MIDVYKEIEEKYNFITRYFSKEWRNARFSHEREYVAVSVDDIIQNQSQPEWKKGLFLESTTVKDRPSIYLYYCSIVEKPADKYNLMKKIIQLEIDYRSRKRDIVNIIEKRIFSSIVND